MTREEKEKIYNKIRMKVAQDGKSHSSVKTKDGAYIDGKLYPFKKEEPPVNNRKKR